MNVCLTLPSRTAVRSATFFGEEIAAVDGLNARIFLFDSCGTCIESVNSLRCYALLRYNPVSNGFVARCDTCGNRVFYLNCFFIFPIYFRHFFIKHWCQSKIFSLFFSWSFAFFY